MKASMTKTDNLLGIVMVFTSDQAISAPQKSAVKGKAIKKIVISIMFSMFVPLKKKPALAGGLLVLLFKGCVLNRRR
jgi:hypothetical protein